VITDGSVTKKIINEENNAKLLAMQAVKKLFNLGTKKKGEQPSNISTDNESRLENNSII